MPFGHLWEGAKQARRRLVERLVRRASPDAMVDAGLAPPEGVRQTEAVHAAGPAHVPRPVVLLGPLPLQHRLRAAVPNLLLPIGANRIAAVGPHHRPRRGAEHAPPHPFAPQPAPTLP